MEILRAEPSDTNEIHHIMSLASSLLDDKGWYCTDTEDYILEHIADRHKGIVFKAAHQGRIGAFFIIHYPGGGDDNLGHYVHLEKEELQKVAYMDSLVVLPDFRGKGLQYELMKHGEDYLASTPYCHLMGTVHPDNLYSLNNFLRLGFKIADTTVKYGSLPRHIMYKKI